MSRHPRFHGRRWSAEDSITLAGILTICVTLGLELSKLVPMPKVVVLGLPVLGALVSIAAVVAKRRSDQRERRHGWEEYLEVAPLPTGVLPAVKDVNPYHIGISPSKYMEIEPRPPYIQRDIDIEIDKSLADKTFILIVGDSKAGKSRTAYEAALRVLPDHALVVPCGEPAALNKLFQPAVLMHLDQRPVLLWLDDIDRYLGADGLDVTLLDRSARCEPSITILATISSLRADVDETAGEVGRLLYRVLSRATEIRLPTKPSQAELDRAVELYPGEDFTDGIGEELVAARVLVRKYENGRETMPPGRAIVEAAIDLRLAGVLRGITEGELRKLYPHYLREMRIDHDPTDQRFVEGLAWARRPVASRAALLAPAADHRTASYEVFDYLVEHVLKRDKSRRRKIPEVVWRLILDTGDSLDVSRAAFLAYLRGQLDIAHEAFRHIPDADAKFGPWAKLGLGLVLYSRKDFEGAQGELKRAIATGNADVASMAALYLGHALAESGDVEGAKAAYQQARLQGDAQAAFHLGVLLAQTGDTKGALLAFEQARNCKDDEIASDATFNLAILLEQEGNTEGAKQAYREAIAFNREGAPTAMSNLAVILAREGNHEEAQQLAERAIAAGDSNIAPVAMVNLALSSIERGDVEKAEDACRQAIASGHVEEMPKATYLLGTLLEQRGDTDEALEMYALAMASEHPEAAPQAAVNRGLLLTKQGNEKEAESACRRALAFKHPENTPRAALMLGTLLDERGDQEKAREMYELAIAFKHPEIGPLAMMPYADLLARAGDIATASGLYEQVITSGHAAGSKAALDLGRLRAGQGDMHGAKWAYEQALTYDDAEYAPWAALYLGTLLSEHGELDGARPAYERAMSSSDRLVSDLGALGLGRLLHEQQQHEDARHALELAMDSDDPDIASMAAEYLGHLLEEQGDMEGARRAYQRAGTSDSAECP